MKKILSLICSLALTATMFASLTVVKADEYDATFDITVKQLGTEDAEYDAARPTVGQYKTIVTLKDLEGVGALTEAEDDDFNITYTGKVVKSLQAYLVYDQSLFTLRSIKTQIPAGSFTPNTDTKGICNFNWNTSTRGEMLTGETVVAEMIFFKKPTGTFMENGQSILSFSTVSGETSKVIYGVFNNSVSYEEVATTKINNKVTPIEIAGSEPEVIENVTLTSKPAVRKDYQTYGVSATVNANSNQYIKIDFKDAVNAVIIDLGTSFDVPTTFGLNIMSVPAGEKIELVENGVTAISELPAANYIIAE